MRVLGSLAAHSHHATMAFPVLAGDVHPWWRGRRGDTVVTAGRAWRWRRRQRESSAGGRATWTSRYRRIWRTSRWAGKPPSTLKGLGMASLARRTPAPARPPHRSGEEHERERGRGREGENKSAYGTKRICFIISHWHTGSTFENRFPKPLSKPLKESVFTGFRIWRKYYTWFCGWLNREHKFRDAKWTYSIQNWPYLNSGSCSCLGDLFLLSVCLFGKKSQEKPNCPSA